MLPSSRTSGMLSQNTRTKWIQIGAIALVAITLIYVAIGTNAPFGFHRLRPLHVAPPGRTLVLYAYYENNDPTIVGNLEFFLRAGVVNPNEPSAALVDTILILNGPCTLDLPTTPRLQIIRRDKNECFDIGAYQEALESLGRSRTAQYEYFVFINSSIRGPFVPVYLRHLGYHWTHAFTSLLNDQVKWVGSTISCAEAAHAQTPVVATDRIGLQVLRDADIFTCPADFHEAIHKWEIGASHAMTKAGYNIGSLQSRYFGVDFRQGLHADCNKNMNPASFQSADGFDLDPFEVMFVKAKSTVQLPLADFTRRYSDYLFGRDDLSTNEFFSPRVQNAIKSAWVAEQAESVRCGMIFDEQYYFDHNKDLRFMTVGAGTLTSHYGSFGFAEHRPHRFVRDRNRLDVPEDCPPVEP